MQAMLASKNMLTCSVTNDGFESFKKYELEIEQLQLLAYVFFMCFVSRHETTYLSLQNIQFAQKSRKCWILAFPMLLIRALKKVVHKIP
jgi:hypothetical protein